MPQSTNKKLGGAACRASWWQRLETTASENIEKFMLDFASFFVY